MVVRTVKTEVYRLVALRGTIYFGELYTSLKFYAANATQLEHADAINELIVDGYLDFDGWNKVKIM